MPVHFTSVRGWEKVKGQIIILEKLNEAVLYLLLLNKRKTEKNLPAKHYREQNKIVVNKRTKIRIL